MCSFIKLSAIAVLVVSLTGCTKRTDPGEHLPTIQQGSVIFIHPDGSGANMWQAMRLFKVGPDKNTFWDDMDHMGLYRSHQADCITTSSHAGATVHAFGKKVPYETYGVHPDRPVISLSGKTFSIMTEAQKAGKSTALINSGHICEPGTGVFVANASDRGNTDTIAEQIIRSGVDIILSGGEIYLIPEGVKGFHGKPGKRKDGKNLIEVAKELGYTVVYEKDELTSLPFETNKVLGVFAAKHTFNDLSEEELAENELPMYEPIAPTLAEMTDFALKLLEYKQRPFLMIIEEEGSDNFANKNNALGALTALSRADEAIGVAQNYINYYPNTLLITAADSDAGGMQACTFGNDLIPGDSLPPFNSNGAPVDGINGTGTMPFIAKPDRNGNELQFAITWATYDDVYGAVIAKAHGLNAERLPNNVDNTEIYKLMYVTLFGHLP
ncbi:MAG: alkaline phosphatase [Bacteroidales bacterium]|nr:alkaline phosphatase [Bacteroidales bacterium]